MPCTFKNGVLQIAVNNDILQVTGSYTVAPKIQVTGLYSPSIPKAYSIRYYIVSSTNTVLESSVNSFTVTTSAISSISVTPFSDLVNHVTTYVVKFTNPSLLQDGYALLSEPGKLRSHIDIHFNMVSGSYYTFAYDLGSGISNYGDYPCELIGIQASIFTTKPRCVLIQGPSSSPSSTDSATIRVLDFNPILAGTVITINIPVLNSASKSLQVILPLS